MQDLRSGRCADLRTHKDTCFKTCSGHQVYTSNSNVLKFCRESHDLQLLPVVK